MTHSAQIQKGGFIVLPYGITLAKFLQDDSLEVFWSEGAAASKLDSETMMSDSKHLPELVPIHITIPLNKVKLQEPEQILPNGRRINANENVLRGLLPLGGFGELANQLNQVEPIAMPQEQI